MGKNKSNISPVKRGMNRNTAPYLLQGMEYLFAYNTNIQDEDTTVINLTNEESNILSTKFDDGFKVIGKKNDIVSKGTYLFLVNPQTGESQFGIIKNNQIEQPDILDELEVPLEEVDQEPYQEFEVMIDKGLNLHIDHPVKKIVIKNEQCGTVIAFTDDYNPPRLFVIEKLEDYLIQDKEVDPDKIAIFKKTLLPEINIQKLVTGGRLKRGTYEFMVAYTNSLGEEISEYTSITNPISIFDKNNVTLEQSEVSDRTNFAIKLKIDNLDSRYEYYKVVVIQNTDIEGAVEYYEEGIHPTSDNTVIYASEENKTTSSLSKIGRTFPYVLRWEGLTESNGHLIGYGMTNEKEVNLQPVVNLMGAFVKWQTSVAKETIYEAGDKVAKYKGYMRNETYPLSIRFRFDSGYTTAKFPFIARPAETFDFFGDTVHELDNAPDNPDVQSILSNNPSFSDNSRTKMWQFYNTAKKEGHVAPNDTVEYIDVTETVTKYSIQENVGVINMPSSNPIIIPLHNNETIDDFGTYIDENKNMFSSENHPLHFLDGLFDVDNYPQHEVPPFETCPECETCEECNDCEGCEECEEQLSNCTDCNVNENPQTEEINVNEVEGSEIEFVGKEIDDYKPFILESQEMFFERDSENEPVVVEIDIEGIEYEDLDEDSQSIYDHFRVLGNVPYKRNKTFQNTSCFYSNILPKEYISNPPSYATQTGYFNKTEVVKGNSYQELLTEFNATPSDEGNLRVYYRGYVMGMPKLKDPVTNAKFYNKIHTNALWFEIDFEEEDDKLYLNITKEVINDVKEPGQGNRTPLRISIYNECGGNPLYTVIKESNQSEIIELDKGDFDINRAIVAIDTPIIRANFDDTFDSGYVNVATRGLYGVVLRSQEYSHAKVTFDEITVDKTESYDAECTFKMPVLDEDTVVPFEYGKFSYIESLEKYPNNPELYDSTLLDIDLNDIPESFKEQFKEYYIQDLPSGDYQLSSNANFMNKPIRHYKFPDNDLVPFISKNQQASFSDSIVFPIGFHIDDEVITTFLDIAVHNNLLTQKQRDSIIAYEIFRGDRTLEKSIEAKGLLYDNYQLEEENEKIYFPNFPFNTLGENQLVYKENTTTFIDHPYESKSNNSFSFISPDNQFRKLSRATELTIEGYQFGSSKTYITNVEDHPEWVILGKKARTLATVLAIAEAVAEVAIQIAEATLEATKTMWGVIGFTNGGGWVGTAASTVPIGVIAGFSAASAIIFKVGRYRHEWLTTFKNLGQPENFAAYSTSLGEYNSLRNLSEEGNILRGINTQKDIKSGRYSFRHNDNGERITLNSQDREYSTYLYLGEDKDFHINYPLDYKNYDNYDIDFNSASRTIASQQGACTKGQSKEILGNVASPYISLKNYIPSQYGSINSIKWLSTSYIGYLDKKNRHSLVQESNTSTPTASNTETIFGGDIFISRMTMKRKTPLFLRDSMRLAHKTPFNYSFYSNIGDTRFYGNYEVSDETNLESTMFPDSNSEYRFDCHSGDNEFYIKPPSKFYLYYYGIPSFLVESEINLNNRYGKKEPEGLFYPNTDILSWTQENFVSIKEPNTFYYNFAYSKPVTTVNSRTLPFTYSKKEYDCFADDPNGAMWSEADESEKDLSEPWLVYKPFNREVFPSSYGKLRDLKGIENDVILGRFENQSAIFGAVDTRVEGIDPYMGDGMLFKRKQTFTETDLGYLGSQTSEMVSCEYGHFFPDTQRGQIFRVDAAGKGMEEISKYSGGKPNGMDKWFRKHLPYKIYNTLINNYENIDVDNAFNGIGVTMGWDSKYKRVFLTKKDYIPLKSMNYEDGTFYGVKDEHELISDYEADGYTYEGKEGLYYRFTKPTVKIPTNTPIFVIINTNDYTIEEAEEIKAEIIEWAEDVPNYEGDLIFIPTNKNNWLGTASQLKDNRFSGLDTSSRWSNISTFKGEKIDNEAIILNFLNSSPYKGSEPTIEFINDYKGYINTLEQTDYLKNILLTKENNNLNNHLSKILNAKDEYKDYPIRGTNPQKFIEPLNMKATSQVVNFDMNTQEALTEKLRDPKGGNETIDIKGDNIPLTNTEFFKDVSFTIGYQVETGSWLSYYSFEPNYYIGHNTYFQTGLNTYAGKEGIWSHNMSNKSYGVFYGEKEPWIIEYPIKNEQVTKRLQNVTFWTEAKKYINDYDFAYDRNITFNKATVYNSYENSGELHLIPQKTLSQISQYPITHEGYQDILITNQDYNWTFNNIYNRTLNQEGLTTAWISDENQIHKDINNDLVQFGGKKILSYLRGDYFIVRLTYDTSSEHSLLMKWATNNEEIY